MKSNLLYTKMGQCDVSSQEKQTLIDRVKQLEEEKSLRFKREEESDELQGLAAQETAKIKHMVGFHGNQNLTSQIQQN